jgi:CRISPR system Cascade subunit CasD
MQAWGVQSRFTVRDTLTEPTKSGVVGLVCAALGRDRTADISDVAALRMGVRVDRPGVVRRDYHTAGRDGFLRADGKVERKNVVESHRHYLADAHFTAALESDDADLLRTLDEALGHPHWPLWLGRKAFPPSAPIRILDAEGQPAGLIPAPLAEVLPAFEDQIWQQFGRKPPRPSRLVLEAGEASAAPAEWREVARPVRPDQPVSFNPRRFALRETVVYVPTEPLHADAPESPDSEPAES